MKTKIALFLAGVILVVAFWTIKNTEAFDPACCHKQCHGGCHMVKCMWHEFKEEVSH